MQEPLRPFELRLSELGLAPEQWEHLRSALRQRSGLIIFTGPISSGLSTMAYECLLELGPQGRSRVSIEDCVKRSLPGVHQLVMDHRIGFNESSALRSVLRADHEVIYLRELVDLEGVDLCLSAVLSQGRLVLTTLHTQDAVAVVTRLLDMGQERWPIARALVLMQAQRKLRRLCLACRRPMKVDPSVLTAAGLPPGSPLPETLYVPGGCERCEGTGYSGWVLGCETLPFTPSLQELLLAGASVEELKQAAVREGMKTLRSSALEHARQGLTSLDEVLLNTPPDAS